MLAVDDRPRSTRQHRNRAAQITQEQGTTTHRSTAVSIATRAALNNYCLVKGVTPSERAVIAPWDVQPLSTSPARTPTAASVMLVANRDTDSTSKPNPLGWSAQPPGTSQPNVTCNGITHPAHVHSQVARVGGGWGNAMMCVCACPPPTHRHITGHMYRGAPC